MEENKKSFWQYLTENNIVIPIIQRDYAQGREDKVQLRKNFLASLKQALDHDLPNGRKTLKLDFVYGSEEDNRMLPLDGQQRLTTLWLMHWFIALKAGVLAEHGQALSRFTYETRQSSREFCKHLCNADNFKNYSSNDDLVQYIKNQTWFSLSWRNDPTIKSMLLMISGTNIDIDKIEKKNKKAINEAKIINAVIDGLSKLFKTTTNDKFMEYWLDLTSDNPPIFFYQLPLKEFGLSDDLYVKMNARGKQLTPFENFKADLIGYIRRRAKDKEDNIGLDKPDADKDWVSLLDARTGIPIKLDTDWTNIFWPNRSKDNSIDEILFSFINRVFWEEFVAFRDGDKGVDIDDEKDAISIKSLEANESFIYLTADNVNEYHDLTPYKFKGGEIPFSLFVHLNTIFDRLGDADKLNALPERMGADFSFLPVYIYTKNSESVSVSKLTQPQRVVFHAIYKYLLEGVYDSTSYSRLMRVVGNLVSGKSLGNEWDRMIIRTNGTMLAALDAVTTLDCHHVYESLAKTTKPNNGKEIPSRLREEIIKAQQILDSDGSLRLHISDNKTWEDIIKEAENYSFFNGSIRFLYLNENADVDWSSFDTKYARAQLYFRSHVEAVKNFVVVNDEYADSADLMRSLISRFTVQQFGSVIWWRSHFLFDNSEKSWRYYLYNNDIAKPLHEFLTNDIEFMEVSDSDDVDSWQHILYLLASPGLLDFAFKRFGNSYIRSYHNHNAIYPSSTGVFLNATRRDDFLHLDDVTVTKGEFVPGTKLLYGSDIDFVFENHNYRWYRDDIIYLMNDDNSNEYIRSDKNDPNSYVSFAAKELDIDQIKDGLRHLITDFQSSTQYMPPSDQPEA